MDEVVTFTRIVPATETMFMVPTTIPLSGAVIDLWFSTSQYYDSTAGGLGQNVTSYLSISRASVGYATNADGTLTQFGNNTLRIGVGTGLLVEDARTNVVLWNRDLTNVLWVAVNITAALNQTGVDGGLNSASSITATAGNGTILQTIVLGSSARFQSAYVKRITGSGTINMTMDNGVTWTAITVTSDWTLATIPAQTLANPIVGFRIVTSGDAIAVDFVQNEDGGTNPNPCATSPIATTTVAATRAADLVSLIGGVDTIIQSTVGSAVLDIKTITGAHMLAGAQIIRGGFPLALMTIPGGGGAENEATDTVNATLDLTNFNFPSGGWQAGIKIGVAGNASARSLVNAGLTVTSDAGPWAYGAQQFTAVNVYCYYRRFTLWNSKLADATLQGFTS